ncbi:hypothetical protein HZS_5828 [Henneguya salminicola]|nr:hypothetical protein HZS_5828 [Henneguya salminicola]
MSETTQTESNTIPLFLKKNIYEGIRSILWAGTILSYIFFQFKINAFGHLPHVWYRRAFLAYAAQSAFRLHQRIQTIHFSILFLRLLSTEDSFHYFVYCLSLLNIPSNICVILPIVAYSYYNLLLFLKKIIEFLLSSYPCAVTAKISSLIQTASNLDIMQTILYLISFNEIFTMFYIIFLAFKGTISIFYILLYFNFLRMRANSFRNTTTRRIISFARSKIVEYQPRTFIPTIITNIPIRLVDYLLAPA